MHFVRLQKYLIDCGIGSRFWAEGMIAEGMVEVNGLRVDPQKDRVVVDG